MVAVVAFDGVVLNDLATASDLFVLARGRDGGPFYDVRICSLRKEAKTHLAVLRVPWGLSSVSKADTVIIPGIGPDVTIPKPLLRAIRQAVDRGARVASICTGAFILAATGALDGLRATTHWKFAAELAKRHPRIDVDASALYIDNGRILTSAGVAANFDLCLHLIRQDVGAERAAELARFAVMPLERAGGQAQFIVHDPPADDRTTIGQLLIWIEQNPTADLSLPSLAKRLGMSVRSFSRHFRSKVGDTPANWIKRARIRYAQRLLETSQLEVERVASESGFGSSAVLRQHFAAIVGTSPMAYRRAFSGK